MLDKRLNDLYEEFKGLPNRKPIVRNGIIDDAYVLLAAEIIYKNDLDYEFTFKNLEKITRYVIAPPDNGIDMFFEHEESDELYYDVIQVKNSDLSEHEINDCFAVMERTINTYLKNPKQINENLREVISSTNFDNTYKKNCTYYVIHKGNLNYCKSLKSNERIITYTDLTILNDSLPKSCVPKEEIKADNFNNFILYGETKDNSVDTRDIKKPRAYLCNLNGYDLAELNNKYSSTEIGKNILFGQNLRDSLEKKSKTFKSMENTINNEPEKFWYYNNGITIIARNFDTKKIEIDCDEKPDYETIVLEDFSIINGAQTTSALGMYLKDANMNKEIDKLDKLKRVYVLTRILEIQDDILRANIAIYNNMQNPITSRDMVSNREEQKQLSEWLIKGEEPKIYVETRRGQKLPNNIRLYAHQKTNNELLAQLVFASFLRSPFTAKDKKRTLFNNDYSHTEYNINEDYHKVFNYSRNQAELGTVFKLKKEDIDELLFIAQLYKLSKKFLKDTYNERINNLKSRIEAANGNNKDALTKQLNTCKRLIEICNICLFYNIALYYEFKAQFAYKVKPMSFRYEEFYSNNNNYKERLIEQYAMIFLTKTIEIIKDHSGESNVSNWIRVAKNETVFLESLVDEITLQPEYEKKYIEFYNEFKV